MSFYRLYSHMRVLYLIFGSSVVVLPRRALELNKHTLILDKILHHFINLCVMTFKIG
jgi:branched-subunit amino acid transport protein